MKEGLIVAIDGRDAVGKTTLTSSVKDKIISSGKKSADLPEFSDTSLGNMITDNVATNRFYSLNNQNTSQEADTLALAADMLLKRQAAQELRRQGAIVVSDRGMLSFLGYQGVRVDQCLEKHMCKGDGSWVADIASGLEFQDMTFWLRISDKEMQRRIINRGEFPLSKDELKFLQNVEKKMGKHSEVGGSTVIVDAEQDPSDLTAWMTSIIIKMINTDLPPKAVANSFLVSEDSSILIKKPEAYSLDHVDRRNLKVDIESLTKESLIGSVTTSLNLLQAVALWDKSIARFSWKYAYYHHMTDRPVEVFLLRGKNTAKSLKKIIREKWQTQIDGLSSESQFQLDLVHGNDDHMRDELSILNLDVNKRVGFED